MKLLILRDIVKSYEIRQFSFFLTETLDLQTLNSVWGRKKFEILEPFRCTRHTRSQRNRPFVSTVNILTPLLRYTVCLENLVFLHIFTTDEKDMKTNET